MFSSLMTESIKMRWSDDSNYQDGRWIQGTYQEKNILASVQDATPRDIDKLGEGFRSKNIKKLFTEERTIQLLEDSTENPDQPAEFVIDGITYKMISSERRRYLIPHYKLMVVKV